MENTKLTIRRARITAVVGGVRQFYMNLVFLKIRNSSTPMGSYVYSNYDFYKPATPSGSNTSICKTVAHPYWAHWLH